MIIKLLCNAGLEIESEGELLFIDLPNAALDPFYAIQESDWTRVCGQRNVCGFCFTHTHPDHYDEKRITAYISDHPDVPIYIPDERTKDGIFKMGKYTIEFCMIDHAPFPKAPPHAALIVSDEERCVYVAGDSMLDTERHRSFLNGRRTDVAMWTPMYLSQASTRKLMEEISDHNYIYHMPQKPSGMEYWKKCESNMMRYEDELRTVQILGNYPSIINL